MVEAPAERPVSRAFQGELDAYRELCAIIGRASLGPHGASLAGALEAARAAHVAGIAADAVARCAAEGEVSEEREWTCWLASVADWLARFRTLHAAAIAAHTPRRPVTARVTIEGVRRTIEMASQSRWEESLDGIHDLAGAPGLPALTVARLTAIAGQIEQWRYRQMDRALALLEQAETLAPDDGWVAAAVGDCWQQLGDGARAREYYERARALAPADPAGYVSEGELHESRSAWEEAEHWFQRAIDAAPGDTLGIDRLIRVLSRPEVLAQNRARVLDLLAQRNAIEPDGAYDAFLSVGEYYQGAGRAEDAGNWFRRACDLQPMWPRAWVRLAQWEDDRQQPVESERLLRHAISIAPEYGDAHLSLGVLLEEQQRWAEALDVYRATPPGSRAVTQYAKALEGRVLRAMGDPDAAEAHLIKTLAADPASEPARIELEGLFRACWEVHQDPERAARVLGRTRELAGAAYEGTYRNLLGNMYYARDAYSEAVAEYQLAVAATPGDAIYHRNLSNALAFTGDYDAAIAALDAAHAIDGDDAKREEGRASIANRRGNHAWSADEYAEAVAAYTQATELNPREAVYWSNLAGALERLDDGDRVATLTRAIEALERSASLAGSAELSARIERVRTRREVLSSFGATALDRLPLVTPIAVDLAANLVPLAESEGEGLQPELAAQVNAMRERIKGEYGVVLPGVRFRGNDAALPDGNYLTSLNTVPVARGAVLLDRRFVATDAASLVARGIAADPAEDPVTRAQGAWVTTEDVQAHHLDAWTPERYLMRDVEAVLRRNLSEFVGHQEVIALLDEDEAEGSHTVRHAPALVSRLTVVVRAMLGEGNGIQPIGAIAAAVAAPGAATTSPRELLESVRALPEFVGRLRGVDGARGLVRAGEPLEVLLRRSLRPLAGELLLALEPDACQAALAAVRDAFSQTTRSVVLDDASLRPFVRRLLEVEWPDAAVVAARELPAGRPLDAVPVVEFEDAGGTLSVDTPLPLHPLPPAPAGPASAPPLIVSLSPETLTWQSPADEGPLSEQLTGLQDALYHELGLLVPPVAVVPDATLGAGEVRVRLGDHVRVLPTLRADEVFINAAVDDPGIDEPRARSTPNPVTGAPACFAPFSVALQARCGLGGYTMWGAHGYIILHLADAVRAHAGELHTRAATAFALDTLGAIFPDTVQRAIERFGVDRIDGVLRALVSERISIGDLRGILEAMLSITGVVTVELGRFIVFTAAADGVCLAADGQHVDTLSAAELAEYVRAFRRLHVTYAHARGSATLSVFLLDPAIEHLVSHGEADEAKRREIVGAIGEELDQRSPGSAAHVLTTPEARPHVAALLRTHFPRVPVLSYAELTHDLNIQPIGRVSLG